MQDLRSRLPAQSLMEQTLRLQREHGRVSPEALSWYTGALGEIAVAGLLAWLGPEWTVLHSVPVGRSGTDIDHVVIGQPGVFTLNTKSHVGQPVWVGGHGLLVSGRRTNYVGKAAAEAARAEGALSEASGLTVPVTPVIVLVSPGERTVKAVPEHGVLVVSDAELLDTLNSRPVFSAEQVERIAAAAVSRDTWDAPPETGFDGQWLSLQFNALMARVQQEGRANGAFIDTAPFRRFPVPLAREIAPSVVSTSRAHLRAIPAATGEALPQPVASVPQPPRQSAPARSSRPPARRGRNAPKFGDALARLVVGGFGVWVLLSAVELALSR